MIPQVPVVDNTLASSQKPRSEIATGLVFNLVNLTFIAYLVYKLAFLSLPGYEVLKEFVMIRNSLYLTYAVMFMVVGLYIISRRLSDPNHKSPGTIIPQLIINLTITTFSYSIASLVSDLLNRS